MSTLHTAIVINDDSEDTAIVINDDSEDTTTTVQILNNNDYYVDSTNTHVESIINEDGAEVFIHRGLFPNHMQIMKDVINTIPWVVDREGKLAGNVYIVPRLVEAYCSPELLKRMTYYPYSNPEIDMKNWDLDISVKHVKIICDIVNRMFDVKLNSCLINYYRNGRDTIAAHSDKEVKGLYKNMVVGVSLGCNRKFRFLDNRRERGTITKTAKGTDRFNYRKFDLVIEGGDVMVMDGTCQKLFKHMIPSEPEIQEERVSLTFRYF